MVDNSSPDRVKWYIESVGTTNGYKIYSKWKDNQGYNDDVERKYYLSYYQDQGPIEEGKTTAEIPGGYYGRKQGRDVLFHSDR